MHQIIMRKDQRLALEYLERFERAPVRKLIYPTGGGKTVIMRALAARHPEAIVVIVTPMRTTVDAILAEESIDGTESKWVRAGGQIPTKPGQYVTTHAMVARWVEQMAHGAPPPLPNVLLLVDEAHHYAEWGRNEEMGAPFGGGGPRRATRVWGLGNNVVKAGGQVILVTATDFRQDRYLVGPAECPTYRQPYSLLAREGILPRNLRLQVVQIDGSSTYEPSDDDLTRMSIEVLSDRDGSGRIRPSIINLPQMARAPRVRAPGDRLIPERDGSWSPTETVANRLVEILVGLGVPRTQVLNSVGPSTQKETEEALLSEREAARGEGYSASRYTIMITCRRLGEAADWPFASANYNFGESSSLTQAIQRLGRSARPKGKIKGYPTKWVDEVKVVTFIPSVATDAGARHLRRAFLVAASLEAEEAMLDWHEVWSAQVENGRLPPALRGPYQTAIEQSLINIASPEELVEPISAMMCAVGAEVEIQGRMPLASEVASRLARDLTPKHRIPGLRYIMGLLPGAEEATKAAATGAISAVAAEINLKGPEAFSPEEAVEVYLAALVRGLEAAIANLGDTPVRLVRDATWEVLMSPDMLATYARSMARARSEGLAEMLTWDRVVALIQDYRRAHGRDPIAIGAHGADNLWMFLQQPVTVRALDRHLRERFGLGVAEVSEALPWISGSPLPPVSELKGAIGQQRYRRFDASVWQKPETLRRARADRSYLVRVGGVLEHMVGLELAARHGWRGLPGGESLL